MIAKDGSHAGRRVRRWLTIPPARTAGRSWHVRWRTFLKLLALDEPSELLITTVPAANIEDILRSYIASGGTVIAESSMDLVQRMWTASLLTTAVRKRR